MRHVPNRKLYKLTRKPIWKLAKCYEMKYWNSLEDSLDPTFKWHRDFEGWRENWIEFGGDECSYGELIKVKGRNLNLK
ncbi:Uncharacterised protein [Streptococcus pneumoniae]|nr:Uncharacterised protein [Streptococcus pneumoniae]